MSFEEFLDGLFLRDEPPAELAHVERLFRGPSAISRFSKAQRLKGLWQLAQQTRFFWDHALPAGERISCVNAIEVLYRDCFRADPHDDVSFMWFDLLLAAAPEGGCDECAPVRRALIGVLDDLLAIDPPAALHGLNHWATPKERAAIIDGFLARTSGAVLDGPGAENRTLRNYALLCREGRAQ